MFEFLRLRIFCPRSLPTFVPAHALVAIGRPGTKHIVEVAERLQDVGINDVLNLRGGILAWIDRIDPSLPRY